MLVKLEGGCSLQEHVTEVKSKLLAASTRNQRTASLTEHNCE